MNRRIIIVFILFQLLSTAACPSTLFAEQVSDSLKRILVATQKPQEKIEILLALSRESQGRAPQESIDYARQALFLAENENLNLEVVVSLNQLSNSYHRLGNFEESYNHVKNALQKATKYKLYHELAEAKNILSTIYNDIGDFDNSARLDFENLRYYEQTGDQEQIGRVLGNIGISFIRQKNYERGLEYLRRSFEIALKSNDLNGMAYQYNNIAGVYFEFFNDYQAALNYYKEALTINSNLNDKRQDAIYLMNIASCFSKLDLADSAMKYFSHSDTILKQLGDKALYANNLVYYSKFLFSYGETDKSIELGKEAIELSISNDYKEWSMLAADMLLKAYLQIGDTIQAYKYSIIYHDTKDILQKQQNEHEIFKLEFQYNFEKSERERKITAQRREGIMFFIIFSLLAGLIIIALLFSRHRLKAKSLALEREAIGKELDFKNKELTINLMALMKKNEMLSEISDKLNDVEKDAKRPETKEAIRKISRDIRHGADDKMLKEFSQRFQEVHVGFYNALLSKFPELTQNELKLCAFLRINMSSKDISELTGQRIETIEQARYRLRRKLGISNSEVNLVTFLSQV
jgi:tetratricopeptide (TPR) repeat protein/DNA-binding CsgD family transcriptional regulator